MNKIAKMYMEWPKKPFQRRVLLPLFIIFILALLFVWEQVTYNELAMEADQMQRERDRLYQYIQYLKAEHDYATGFEIIEKKVRTDLGMHFPKEGPVILVMPDYSNERSISSAVRSFWHTIRLLVMDEK